MYANQGKQNTIQSHEMVECLYNKNTNVQDVDKKISESLQSSNEATSCKINHHGITSSNRILNKHPFLPECYSPPPVHTWA